MTLPPDPRPAYVTDTHLILWYMIGDKRLSQSARQAFHQIDAKQARLVIPAVVLSEMFMVIEKQRLPIPPPSFLTIVQRLPRIENILLSSLTYEIVVHSSALTAIPDIFDRLIVAESHRLNVPLNTGDTVITQSQLVKVVW